MATFTTEQFLPVTFKIVDGRGRPVPVDGEPVVASSDETVVVASAPTNDGAGNYSMELASVAAGTARVTVTADADISPEVSEILAILEVEVTLDPRTSARMIELTAGEPSDEPLLVPSGN